MNLRSASITALLLALLVPQTSFAVRRDDDFVDTLRAIVRPLRTTNEMTESTEKTYRSLPISGIQSFSFPVTWATRPVLQTKALEPRLSKTVTDALVQKLLFTPQLQKDGTWYFGLPLGDYLTATYSPLLINDEDTPELHVLRVQKIIATDTVNPPENRGYIQFCSFKPAKKTSTAIETVYIKTLPELRQKLMDMVTMHNDINFDGDFYVPNLYTFSAATGSSLLGAPAVKFTMTFDSQRYDFVAERMQYEALYALKDDKVICAEVVAIEPQFEAYKQVFQSIVQSAKVTSSSGSTSTQKINEGTKKVRASSAKDRLCKRTKKCS